MKPPLPPLSRSISLLAQTLLGAILLLSGFAADAGESPRYPRRPAWSAPADPDTFAPFTFAILGDRTSGGEENWPLFDRVVDAINAKSHDFVITTGDHIPGHMEDRSLWESQWREYWEHASRLRPPLWLVPGNHDIANTACHGFWREDLGDTYFSFTHKGCLFLVLNTEEERFDGRGPMWQAMLSHAAAALKNHPNAPHTFMFFHKPMWADPRFGEDWRQLVALIGDRSCTVVAGHEHYLATERRDNLLLVIQNATGGGISLSDAKIYGGYHGYAEVSVSDAGASYTVVEPDGTRHAPEESPLCFRKQVEGLITLTAEQPPRPTSEKAWSVSGQAIASNPFPDPIAVRVRVPLPPDAGWLPAGETAGALREGKDLVLERSLAPGEAHAFPLVFTVTDDALSFPPPVTHQICHGCSWLDSEPMRMEQVPVVPLYPREAWRAVRTWRFFGPVSNGPMADEKAMRGDPRAAWPRLFAPTGHEAGPGRDSEEGRWRPATGNAAGLVNCNALMGTADLSSAFFFCEAVSPRELSTHALLYADNYAQLFVEGVLVDRAQAISAPGGFVCVPVRLKAGANRLVVKVTNNRGDWFFRFLLADPTGELDLSGNKE